MTQLFEHAVIVGLGLIGSSLARDLRALGLAGHITGIDPSETERRILTGGGVLDDAHAVPTALSAPADLLLIATPPASWPHLSQTLPALTAPNALIMDVGSVKRRAAELFTPAFAGRGHFIPAHPIAGSASSGAAAGQQGLFEERRVILCPAEGTAEIPLRIAHHFWQALGAEPQMLPADAHDRIYANVSHLPQMIAFAATRMMAAGHDALPEHLQPFLRLGSSNPVLWSDLALANADYLGEAMEQFLHLVSHIGTELRSAEAVAVESPEDAEAARLSLTPRIIASALVGSVSLAEKQHKIRMASFAGTGFADVASPATRPPEDDLERISAQHEVVAASLRQFEGEFRTLLLALREQNRGALEAYMEEANDAHRRLF